MQDIGCTYQIMENIETNAGTGSSYPYTNERENNMDRKKRIEYLAVTWTMFASVVLMFYFAGDFSSSVPVENEKLFRLAGSLMMGYVLTGLLSGIMLAARFFARRSLRFKVLAAALWMVTMLAVFGGGEFLLIPYQIYNLIQIVRSRSKDEPAEAEYVPDEEDSHAD